jgi:hypothetical protein
MLKELGGQRKPVNKTIDAPKQIRQNHHITSNTPPLPILNTLCGIVYLTMPISTSYRRVTTHFVALYLSYLLGGHSPIKNWDQHGQK